MKKIMVEMTYDADIIEVPDDVEKNIKKYQKQFDKWIHDKTTEHSYWVYKNGKKYCPQFRGDAFVEYLNQIILKEHNEKARVIEMYTKDDSGIKCIWF